MRQAVASGTYRRFPMINATLTSRWPTGFGARVARAQDAQWCLEWLDEFEALVRRAGRFDHDHQLVDIVAVIDEAREYYWSLVS
jgi:hypothetical protein